MVQSSDTRSDAIAMARPTLIARNDPMTRRRPRGFRLRATAWIAVVSIAAVLFGTLESQPAAAVGSATISGVVTAPGGIPLRGVGVFLKSATDGSDTYLTHALSDEAGRYSFGELETGTYKVLFQPQREEPTSYNYVAEWWQNASDLDSATAIPLSAGAGRNVSAELTPGASISGTITDGSGVPIHSAVIWARLEGGHQYSAKSDRNGTYMVGGLPSGNYKLEFESPWSGSQAIYVDEWWDNASAPSSAASIALATGQSKTGFDAQLSTGSTISGRVLDLDGTPMSDVYVEAMRVGGEAPYEHGAYSSEGNYSISGLPAGTYDLAFTVNLPTGWVIEMWRDAPWYVGETTIEVGDDEVIELEDARVGSDVERNAGASRYTTAVGVSKSAFPWGGVPVVYVASGQDFPDALAAAPAAGLEGGPMLLTPRDALPQEVAEEIARLRPARIIVVGGESSVGAGVARRLNDLTDGPVERRAGPTRYETAAEISRSQFPSAAVVYLASGSSFPDALAAAPLARDEPGPVLLTPRDSLPGVVADELRRLKPAKIVVLGGEGAVGPSVVEQLAELAPVRIERLAGQDRFATAVAISESAFPSTARVVYVANGLNFPDALAVAPVALRDGAPILLTRGESLTQEVIDEIARLRPNRITVLGGPSVVSDEVSLLLARMAARF